MVATVVHAAIVVQILRRLPGDFHLARTEKWRAAFRTAWAHARGGGSLGGCNPWRTGSSSSKEDLCPATADAWLFKAAPFIVFTGSFAAFISLPWSDGWSPLELDAGLFFILAVMSVEVVGVIFGGYASGSKWSLFGGMREAAQVVSYEIPMALCAMVPVAVAGTLNVTRSGGCRREASGTGSCFAIRSADRVFRVLPRGDGWREAGTVRPGRGRERTGGGIPHRVQRHSLVVLLHGRIREHVRRQRFGGAVFLGGWHSGLAFGADPLPADGVWGWLWSAAGFGCRRESECTGVRADVGALDVAPPADRPGVDHV